MNINLANIDFIPGQGGGGVKPSGSLDISENGVYNVYSYASASVDVHPSASLSETYISNGSYNITGEFNGGVITVDVPAPQFVTETLNVSANGTYNPGEGVDGYSQVVVDVPQSVTGFTEKEVTEGIQIVNLSNSASYVHPYVFAKDNYLQTVYLPNCISVGENAFAYCYNLTTVSLPECKTIGSSAFDYCQSLTEVYLPKCEYISYYAFYGCKKLSVVSFSLCSYIKGSAFGYCSSITEVYLPNCEYIGQSAFGECKSITEVYLPNCISLGDPFYYTSVSYLELPKIAILSFGYGGGNRFGPKVLSISLCRDVAVVPDTNGMEKTYMFYNTNSVYVPSETYDAFVSIYSNFSSKFISYPVTDGPLLSFSNGLMYGKTKGLNGYVWDILKTSKESLTEISLPNCEYIFDYYNYPFNNCQNLSVISLPKCKVISGSFNSCIITKLYLPEAYEIPYEGFRDCKSLSEIDLPKVKEIPQYTFRNCSLKVIKLSVCSNIGSNGFYAGLQDDASVYLYSDKVCSIGGYPFRYDTKIYVPASLVYTYKSAPIWSQYSNSIFPIE